jgi:hypothetical protein
MASSSILLVWETSEAVLDDSARTTNSGGSDSTAGSICSWGTFQAAVHVHATTAALEKFGCVGTCVHKSVQTLEQGPPAEKLTHLKASTFDSKEEKDSHG